MSVFVEVAFGFYELVVDPEAECPRLWTTQENRPAGFIDYHGVSMQGVSVSERPTAAEDGTIGANIGIATTDDPTDEPPGVVVHVRIIIGLEPMMNANREEV